MKTPIRIHYFKKDQRLEFTCPFCEQVQGWTGSVRIEMESEVFPDPITAFKKHTLGNGDKKDVCLVEPAVDEVDEYEPVVTIEP